MSAPAAERPARALFPVSGRSWPAVAGNARRLADWLQGPGADTPLADVGHTLALRRSALSERLVVSAADHEGLVRALRRAAAELSAPEDGRDPGESETVWDEVAAGADQGPVFVFSGHGSQWDGMGAELLETEPVFQAAVETLRPVVWEESGLDLEQSLTKCQLHGAGMDQVQPAVFATQYGLAQLWRHYGIQPAAVIGHSMGEVAAAVVAGGLSPADGARVVCRRSRLMTRRLTESGATALVELAPERVRERLRDHPGVHIAVHSSPRACVVAGEADQVRRFVARCQREDLLAKEVPGVRIAAHSPQVEPILAELTRALDDLRPGMPSLTWYSTVTDDVRRPPALDAGYWADNLRRPVRLTEAVSAAWADGLRLFVEVSPHPVVTRSLTETLNAAGATSPRVIGTLRRDTPAGTAMSTALARAHCAGASPRWDLLHPAGRLCALPTYAWQRPPLPEPVSAPAVSTAHPLLGHGVRLPGRPVRRLWQAEIGLAALPWLADHRVHGTAVLPGTGYAEAVLAAACAAFETTPATVLIEDLEYRRVLPLSPAATVTTTLALDDDGRAASVELVTGHGEAVTVLASARVRTVPRSPSPPARDVAGLVEEGARRHDPETVYGRLRALGQRHGPAFARVEDLHTRGDTVVSRLRVPEPELRAGDFHLHPAVLDAALHAVGALLPEGARGTVLPIGVRRLRYGGGAAPARWAVARLRTDPGDADALVDVEVLTDDGELLAELTGMRLSAVDEETLPVAVSELLYTVEWRPAPEPPAPRSGRWLVYADTNIVDPDRETLLAELAAAGLRPEVVDWDTPLPPPGPEGLPHGVLLLGWGSHDDPELAALGVLDTAELAAQRVATALALTSQLLRDDDGGRPPALLVLTRGAQPVVDGDRPDPVQAGLRGLVRTLRHERPELLPRLVDLDQLTPNTPWAAEVCDTRGPDEVAWRRGVRYTAAVTRPTGPVSRPAPAAPLVRAGGGYLVTGGTRGIGLAAARWLFARGAGVVVLGGRGHLSAEAEEQLTAAAPPGATLAHVPGDLADPDTADRLVAAVAEHGAVLRGVLHTAGVRADATVTQLDVEGLRQAWGAKARGAWYLHQATARHPVDWWVGFSSLASLFGSAGQAAYAAANAFLDALVALRRAEGLPAVSVNWGPWSDLGQVRGQRFPGFVGLRTWEGLTALEAVISSGLPQVGVARLDAATFPAAFGHTADSSFLRGLAPELAARSDQDVFDPAALDAMGPAERRTAVQERALRRMAEVLGFTDPARIANRPLVHLGLDSLAALRIRNALRTDFAVDLPVSLLLRGTTGVELAEDLYARLEPGTAPPGNGEPTDAVRQAREKARARAARRRTPRGGRRGGGGV